MLPPMRPVLGDLLRMATRIPLCPWRNDAKTVTSLSSSNTNVNRPVRWRESGRPSAEALRDFGERAERRLEVLGDLLC